MYSTLDTSVIVLTKNFSFNIAPFLSAIWPWNDRLEADEPPLQLKKTFQSKNPH